MVKFIGDNVDVLKGVRDIRSDHVKHLCHMYTVQKAVYHQLLPLLIQGHFSP